MRGRDKTFEELRAQVRVLKNDHNMLASQLEKSGKCHQTQDSEQARKLDELTLKLSDAAHKRDLKESEARANSAVDAKLALAAKEASQKLSDFQKQTLDSQQELAELVAEGQKRLRSIEKQQEAQETRTKEYTVEKFGEMQAEMKRQGKTAAEATQKVQDDLAARLAAHEAEARVWKKDVADEQKEQNDEIRQLKSKCAALEKLNEETRRESAERWREAESRLEEKLSRRLAEVEEKRVADSGDLRKHAKDSDEKMQEMEQLQGDFATGLSELKESAKIRQEETKAAEQEREDRMEKLEKEVTDLAGKCDAAASSEDTGKRLEGFEKKIKAIEADLEHRQSMFVKYDSQMKSYEDRYSVVESKYQKSMDALGERCKQIEESVAQLSRAFDVSSGRLNERIDDLERRLQDLRTELRDVLTGYAREIKRHREELASLRHARSRAPSPARTYSPSPKPKSRPKARTMRERKVESSVATFTAREVSNVGVNVVLDEKLTSTAQVGTDTLSQEVQVQTEAPAPAAKKPAPLVPVSLVSPLSLPSNIPKPKRKPEKKKEVKRAEAAVQKTEEEVEEEVKLPAFESIMTQDAKQPAVKESSSVFNSEENRVVSEHESEEEEEINLNPLIQKTPRPVSYLEQQEAKERRPAEGKEEGLEFGRRKSAPPTDLSVRSYQIGEDFKENTSRRYMSLQVPSVRDFFGSSPHYLREDPIRSKDKKSIISTQGVTVENNISSRNFRQPEKFNVNLNDIAKIEQEEAPRLTYAEIVNYNDINFENYNPPPPDDAVESTLRGSSRADLEAARVLDPRQQTPPKRGPSASAAYHSEYSGRSGNNNKSPLEALPEVAESNDSPSRHVATYEAQHTEQRESEPLPATEPVGDNRLHQSAIQDENDARNQPGEEQEVREEDVVQAFEGGAESRVDEDLVEQKQESGSNPAASAQGAPMASPHEEMQSDEAINEAHQMLSGLKEGERRESEASGEAGEEDNKGEVMEPRLGQEAGTGQKKVETPEREYLEAREQEQEAAPPAKEPENLTGRQEVERDLEDFAMGLDDKVAEPEQAQEIAKKEGSASAGVIPPDKMKKIIEVNTSSMTVYEEDRRRAEQESQRMYSGYAAAGPRESDQNEDLPHSGKEEV